MPDLLHGTPHLCGQDAQAKHWTPPPPRPSRSPHSAQQTPPAVPSNPNHCRALHELLLPELTDSVSPTSMRLQPHWPHSLPDKPAAPISGSPAQFSSSGRAPAQTAAVVSPQLLTASTPPFLPSVNLTSAAWGFLAPSRLLLYMMPVIQQTIHFTCLCMCTAHLTGQRALCCLLGTPGA